MFQERRATFRCPVQSHDGPALLKVSGKELVVQLIEESAGGFGVVATQVKGLREGQEAMLTTTAGRYEVRIAHLTQVGETTRVGLNRLADLNDKTRTRLFGWLPFRAATPQSRGWAALLLFALCGCFFFWGTAFPSAWWRDFTWGEIRIEQTPEQRARQREVLQDEREKLFVQSFRLLDELTSRDFTESLELSRFQKRRISKIVDQTTEKLEQLVDNRGAAQEEQWVDAGLSLIVTSWKEIQAVLTDEQRARWHDMLEG
jgi:hypothetical protein